MMPIQDYTVRDVKRSSTLCSALSDAFFSCLRESREPSIAVTARSREIPFAPRSAPDAGG